VAAFEIDGTFVINGKPFSAQSLITALLNQGIDIRSEDYGLAVGQRLVRPEPFQYSSSTQFCPFQKQIEQLRHDIAEIRKILVPPVSADKSSSYMSSPSISRSSGFSLSSTVPSLAGKVPIPNSSESSMSPSSAATIRTPNSYDVFFKGEAGHESMEEEVTQPLSPQTGASMFSQSSPSDSNQESGISNRICPECGAPMPSRAVFCTRCRYERPR
jgi:ribosomal protein L40E